MKKKVYSYSKSAGENSFFTVVRGNEWKCYTKFYSGAIEVTTCSGGYIWSKWLR